MEQVCRDLGFVESQQISCKYIGTVRDAFCELVKKHSHLQLQQLVDSAPPSSNSATRILESVPIYLRHIHDEASMRMRSYQQWDDVEGRMAQVTRVVRGRSSKVQNHAVAAQLGDVEVELFTELQALMNKRADTIGQALILVLENVLRTVASSANVNGCECIRVVHLITGDGIGTNKAAVRRVACKFCATRCCRRPSAERVTKTL